MFNLIEKRRSVRTYQNRPLSNKDMGQVNSIIEEYADLSGPFNHKVNLFLVENKNKENRKIGTYGLIKNPPLFMGGVVNKSFNALVDFAFVFEQIILRLTSLDLGTVWLGGTFNRKDFNLKLNDGQVIAAVSPVGYIDKPSIREKLMRGFAHANKRLPLEHLFFEGEDLCPINQDHKLIKYFRSIQYGPSASNKQPWRVVLIDHVFHFYLSRTKRYENLFDFDLQAMDMGIALSHLYLTLEEDEIKPVFINQDPCLFDDLTYVLSIGMGQSIT